MMDADETKFRPILPFKSPAGALILSLLLGPLGLLYATVTGGVVMLLLGLVVLNSKLLFPIILLWVASCVWSAAAVNKYNKTLMKFYLAK